MAGLLDRIATQVATPRTEVARYDPVSMEEFSHLLTTGRGNSVRTKAGNTVGPQRVLGITAWYSGCRYLTESVAGLPWHHYQRISDKGRERRAPQTWLEQPDVDWTWYGLVEHWMMAMLHKGNTFSFKLRNAIGQVIGLREIHPDRVTTGIGPDGSKRFMVGDSPVIYTTHDILHIAGMAYDCRFGINPIHTLGDSLGSVAAAEDYASRFFANGTHVGGIISVPQGLNPTSAEVLREEWDRFHEGLVNAHKTGVLSKGATYERISLNAAETQLLETRQYGISEVSRALRLPPHKLYDLTHATFSNIEEQNIDATTDSVRPWVQRIETAINADPDLMLPGHFIEASMEGLLRGDSAARASFYKAGIDGGWLMPATAARLENQPAPVELEYYLRPLNMDVIRPGEGPPKADDQEDAKNLSAAEVLQKVYLAVGAGVISVDEARAIANKAGAQLTGTPPPPAQKALTVGGSAA